MRARLPACAAAVTLAAAACSGGGDGGGTSPSQPAASGPFPFTDVTASSGVDFVPTAGRTPPTQIVEVKGGGLALIDVDADGDHDLFVPNGATLDSPEHGPGAALFVNEGGLRFSRAVGERAPELDGWGMGVAVGDVDADGWDDAYVACFRRDVLLRNESGRLVDARGDVPDEASWGTGCAFGDVDADGDLDLYVANYLAFDPDRPPAPTDFLGIEVFTGPSGLPPQADVLLVNDGDGAFSDTTAAAGCAGVAPAYGLGALIVDLDLDGLQDVFVGNDSTRNFLFANRNDEPGDPRFEEIGLVSGLACNADGDTQATMGIAIGDVDGDGLPDLFSTNFMNDTNTLHVNRGGLSFADRTQPFGLGMVSRPFLGWAAAFLDLDHDGDEDLVTFNGHVYPDAAARAMGASARQTPLVFERKGARFERRSSDDPASWLAQARNDRTAVFGDLDGDLDLDMVVAERNGPLRVLRGEASARAPGTGVVVALHDARPGAKNPRGLGSRVRLEGAGPAQTRWIVSGPGYLSASAPEAHFAVPRGAAFTLTVTWPDGHVQTVDVEAPGRVVVER